MASQLTVTTFLKEDFKGQEAWIDTLLGPLNSFMQQVANALNNTLSFADNFNASIKQIDVRVDPTTYATTFANLTVAHGLKGNPVGVQVIRVFNKALPAVGTSGATVGVSVDWDLSSGGQIKVRNISGLTPGQNYVVTLLFIGG